MKKTLSSFLLILVMVIFVSACSSDDIAIQGSTVGYRTDLAVRADAGNGQVTLEWQMDPDAVTYNIYYMEDDGSNTRPDYSEMKAVTPSTGIKSAPYTVPGLTNGKKYWFSITGVNSNGESYLALPTSSTPTNPAPLPAPENLRANAGNQKVTITWTPVTGADYYVLYCYWQEGTNADEGSIKISGESASSQVVDSTTIEWYIDPDGGIINDRTYYFWIYAVDNNGTPSDKTNDIASSPSFAVWATPSATPPPLAPELISATPGNGEVTLTWNSVTGATSYNVYVDTAKGIKKDTARKYFTDVASGSAVAGLTNDVTYYFVVTAVNNNGTTSDTTDDLESTESIELSATPTAP
ncbi:MAG: fibronectin type III domain-containing protein [Smithella sp.]